MRKRQGPFEGGLVGCARVQGHPAIGHDMAPAVCGLAKAAATSPSAATHRNSDLGQGFQELTCVDARLQCIFLSGAGFDCESKTGAATARTVGSCWQERWA